jgi:hypothetical protein
MHNLRQTASRNTQFSASRLTAALLVAFAGVTSASAATLSVGPGKTYATPCKAFAVAHDGDVIEITGGTTYSGDVCTIARSNLTIRGVNGRPKIDAAGKNAAGKGTWVVDGNNIVVDNVEMYGAKVPDMNGAAFRLEGTNFTLRNSFIHDNQDGILANANANSDILIEYTEFGHNGAGDGQSHNLYIGHVKSLTFRYSFSHDANIGHNLKSRADTNMIAYSRFSSLAPGQTGSTAAGKPSYEIDLPNAGTSYIIGNVIEQPSANSNSSMLAYGEEGASNTGKDLYVINNTFLNDYSGGTFMFIGSTVSTPALAQNNIFAGVGNFSTQASTIDKTNYRAAAPSFVNRAAYDLHPTGAQMIDMGSDPGTSSHGVSLVPVAQYKSTASGEARPVSGKLDIGAYEATTTATTTSPTPTTSPSPTPTTSTVTWTKCASEGQSCAFTGKREVRYGTATLYTSKVVTGPVWCNNATFGDPARGYVKTCSYSSVTQ